MQCYGEGKTGMVNIFSPSLTTGNWQVWIMTNLYLLLVWWILILVKIEEQCFLAIMWRNWVFFPIRRNTPKCVIYPEWIYMIFFKSLTKWLHCAKCGILSMHPCSKFIHSLIWHMEQWVFLFFKCKGLDDVVGEECCSTFPLNYEIVIWLTRVVLCIICNCFHLLEEGMGGIWLIQVLQATAPSRHLLLLSSLPHRK